MERHFHITVTSPAYTAEGEKLLVDHLKFLFALPDEKRWQLNEGLLVEPAKILSES